MSTTTLRRLARLEKSFNLDTSYADALALNSEQVIDAAPFFRKLGLNKIADYLERVRRTLGME